MSKKHIQIGECPECGAPLLMLKDAWEQGEPIYDQAWQCFYMPGIIYTCKCYAKIVYNVPAINIPSVWTPLDGTTWDIVPEVAQDTGGNTVNT